MIPFDHLCLYQGQLADPSEKISADALAGPHNGLARENDWGDKRIQKDPLFSQHREQETDSLFWFRPHSTVL